MKTIDLAKCGLLTAILMITAQISINIGPIPLTGGVLGILLIGYILKPTYALMSTSAYIILGVCGLPVFAGFKGGYGVILQSTGGYIFAYPIMALTISFIIKKIGNRKILTLLIAAVFGIFILYLFGTLWFVHYMKMSFSKALTLCVYPFIPGEIIKIILSILFISRISSHRSKL